MPFFLSDIPLKLARDLLEASMAAPPAWEVIGSSAIALLGAAVAVVLVAGLATYRLGMRHRAAQARRLRERLVGRLRPR